MKEKESSTARNLRTSCICDDLGGADLGGNDPGGAALLR